MGNSRDGFTGDFGQEQLRRYVEDLQRQQFEEEMVRRRQGYPPQSSLNGQGGTNVKEPVKPASGTRILGRPCHDRSSLLLLEETGL